MSDEKKLAYTVHVDGRRYRKGMTASDIGEEAAKIGDHAWEGYEPRKSTGATGAIVESRSGLPGVEGTSIPLVVPDGGEVDQEELERRLTPPATVPDGMGGDATTEIPGVTAQDVEDADGDADAAKPEGSVKKPTATSGPAKKAAPAKRTGSRNGSDS